MLLTSLDGGSYTDLHHFNKRLDAVNDSFDEHDNPVQHAGSPVEEVEGPLAPDRENEKDGEYEYEKDNDSSALSVSIRDSNGHLGPTLVVRLQSLPDSPPPRAVGSRRRSKGKGKAPRSSPDGAEDVSDGHPIEAEGTVEDARVEKRAEISASLMCFRFQNLFPH